MGRPGHVVRRAIVRLGPWAGLTASTAAAAGALLGAPAWSVALGVLAGAGLLLAAERRAAARARAHAVLVLDEAPDEGALDSADSGARLFAEVRRRHREVVSDLRREFGRITDAAASVHKRGQSLSVGAEAQTFSIDETLASILEISRSVQAMVSMVEKLFSSTEAASTSVLSMIQGIRLIGDSSRGLLDLVADVSAAIDRQADAVEEVRRGAAVLSDASRVSGRTMTQMATSIAGVATHAAEAARAAGAVATDADRGRDAVARASAAVARMRDTVRASSAALDKLGERGREIGAITTTIEQITDRTNLLALNAAIIAAQAGEQGKSFAVVAGEIKRLAEQTARSTVEIGALIRAIQEEVAQAMQANEAGGAGAEHGVQLVEEAARALDQILDSARRASAAAEEIARAAADQASGSDAIIRTTREEAERIEAMAGAIDRHAAKTQEVQALANRMLELTREVTRVNDEQQQATTSIKAVVQEVKQLVESMSAVIRQQGRGSDQIIQATEVIRYISSENLRAIGEMFGAVGDLKGQIERFEAAFGGLERP